MAAQGYKFLLMCVGPVRDTTEIIGGFVQVLMVVRMAYKLTNSCKRGQDFSCASVYN